MTAAEDTKRQNTTRRPMESHRLRQQHQRRRLRRRRRRRGWALCDMLLEACTLTTTCRHVRRSGLYKSRRSGGRRRRGGGGNIVSRLFGVGGGGKAGDDSRASSLSSFDTQQTKWTHTTTGDGSVHRNKQISSRGSRVRTFRLRGAKVKNMSASDMRKYGAYGGYGFEVAFSPSSSSSSSSVSASLPSFRVLFCCERLEDRIRWTRSILQAAVPRDSGLADRTTDVHLMHLLRNLEDYEALGKDLRRKWNEQRRVIEDIAKVAQILELDVPDAPWDYVAETSVDEPG